MHSSKLSALLGWDGAGGDVAVPLDLHRQGDDTDCMCGGHAWGGAEMLTLLLTTISPRL